MREQNRQNSFEGLAKAYSDTRPTYPSETLQRIHKYCTQSHLEKKMVIVDVGAGTGIFTEALAREFAEEYSHIIGVEPGSDMRHRAHLVQAPHVSFVDGSAEALPVSDQSVNLITIAQAIHWFDRSRFYREALRALVLDGSLAIISNDRDWRNSAFLARHEEILEDYGITKEGGPYHRTYREYPLIDELKTFFTDVEEFSFHWKREMTTEQFLTMALSSTQVQRAIARNGEKIVVGHIRSNLQQHAEDNGSIFVHYETKLYLARKGGHSR